MTGGSIHKSSADEIQATPMSVHTANIHTPIMKEKVREIIIYFQFSFLNICIQINLQTEGSVDFVHRETSIYTDVGVYFDE